jgi:hypothetical protein
MKKNRLSKEDFGFMVRCLLDQPSPLVSYKKVYSGRDRSFASQ